MVRYRGFLVLYEPKCDSISIRGIQCASIDAVHCDESNPIQ